MIVQANGSVVIGGSRGGFMTLARYTPAGALDTSFGINGFATAAVRRHPGSGPGNSGATAMTHGCGRQHHRRRLRRVAVDGRRALHRQRRLQRRSRLLRAAPDRLHGARASPCGGRQVVLVGYARDRHPSIAVPATPAVIYGQRAVVTLPRRTGGHQHDGLRHLLGQRRSLARLLRRPDRRPRPRRHARARPRLAGRPLLRGRGGQRQRQLRRGVHQRPRRRVVGAERFTAAGVGTLDTTFNAARRRTPGRLPVAGVNLHAIKLARRDGSPTSQASRSTRAVGGNRQMLIARVDGIGALGTFGAGGIARAKVARRQQHRPGAGLPGRQRDRRRLRQPRAARRPSAWRASRAAGARDTTFGANGQVVTPFGAPAVNGFITGMAVNRATSSYVSGRLTDPAGLATVAARYFATGAPPPPLPAPAASTQGVDQITTSSARVSGTVNTNGPPAPGGSSTAPRPPTAPRPRRSRSAPRLTTSTCRARSPVSHRAPRTTPASSSPARRALIAGDDVAFTTPAPPLPAAPPARPAVPRPAASPPAAAPRPQRPRRRRSSSGASSRRSRARRSARPGSPCSPRAASAR